MPEIRPRWTVAAAAIVIQLCLGSIYAWSVFVEPLRADFAWTRPALAATFSIVLVAYAVGMVVGGRWQDTAGPRLVATVGGVLLGSAYVLASFSQSLVWLYVTYGALGGLGVGLGYACPVAACIKWFPDRRGLATGLAVAGFGAGSLIFAPTATQLIAMVGWRTTFLVLGVLFFVIVVTAARFLTNPPADWRPPLGATYAGGRPAATLNARGLDWKEVVRTRTFWILWAVFCLGTAVGLMVIGHMAVFLQEDVGVAPNAAALAVGVLAVLNGGGRVAWGVVADRIGRLVALRAMLVILGSAALALAFAEAWTALLLAAGLMGLAFGGLLMTFPTLTADYFGTAHVGTHYGILFTAYGAAGIAGPLYGATVFEATGGYTQAFVTGAVVAFSALGISALLRPAGHR